MPWPKGKPRTKTGGRKKGTLNHDTRDIKEIVESYLKGQTLPEVVMQKIQQVMNPRESAKLMLDLMSFIYPRRKATEVSGKIDTGHADEVAELLKWYKETSKI